MRTPYSKSMARDGNPSDRQEDARLSKSFAPGGRSTRIGRMIPAVLAAAVSLPSDAGEAYTHPLFGNPEFAAGELPWSVAVGDLDGDLDLDLAVANGDSGDVSVLINNGSGTFAPQVTYAAGSTPRSVAMGDLDGDLDLDLAVANGFDNDVSVLLNNGDGTFAPQVTYGAGVAPGRWWLAIWTATWISTSPLPIPAATTSQCCSTPEMAALPRI